MRYGAYCFNLDLINNGIELLSKFFFSFLLSLCCRFVYLYITLIKHPCQSSHAHVLVLLLS